MNEELTKVPDFRIACCNLCARIIRNKINNVSGNDQSEEMIIDIKNRFHLTLQLNEILEIAKNIYKENLANDKYGTNNLKEVL